MYAERPNHNKCILTDVAIAIAVGQSRLAAVEFLFRQGCTPDSIISILTRHKYPSSNLKSSYRLTHRVSQSESRLLGCLTSMLKKRH